MKTLYELKYERLIISSISERNCCRERTDLFLEFHTYGTTYYEELCRCLYELSAGETEGTLFLTPAGKAYIGSRVGHQGDKAICNHITLPAFDGDLLDQLDFFFQVFQGIRGLSF